jgi:hypothetical protein
MKAFTAVNPGGFHVQRMRGGFQPVPYQQTYQARPQMGQIQINPNISAPINIGLGSLPLSLGLFAGSGMALLIGSQAPSIRTVTTITSIGLAVLGALNLLAPKDVPPPAGPPTTTAVTPGQSSGPVAPTAEEGFRALDGRIISPSYGDTIDVSPIGTPNVPMRVRLTNKSPNADANFDLVITSDEQPKPFGARVQNSQTMRVFIPRGETRDVDVSVGISSWEALVDYVEVDVTVAKRRIDGGNKENLAGVMFVVE